MNVESVLLYRTPHTWRISVMADRNTCELVWTQTKPDWWSGEPAESA